MQLRYAGYSRMLRRAEAFLREHPGAIVVANARHAADDLVRSACENALIGVERYALRDLVYALSSPSMDTRGLAPVHRIAREALAASAAREAELTYLREVAEFPGFPRALARTLEELRLSNVTPEGLRACGRSGPDLAVLLELYERELKDRRLADYPLRVQLAIERIREAGSTAVLLLHPDAPTKAERELLDTLTACSTHALDLKPSGEGEPVKVSLLSASSEALECVEIARRILYSGVPFDECAVLLRNPQRHGPLLAEALERAGIPAWLAGGARKPDLAGRALIALLRCREENLDAGRFAEYLSLSQVPLEDGQSVYGWEHRLREARVIAGLARWEKRLDAVVEQKYRDYQKASEEDSERIARTIGQLEALKGFAIPVVRRLAALPDRAVWREWIRAIEELAPVALKNPHSVEELLGQLNPLADLGPVSLQQVILTLERNLLTSPDDDQEARYGRVFVGDIEDARAMSFRHVYVPGLNEGLFPRPVREDPLLLDEQRQKLGIRTSQDDLALLEIVAACTSEQAAFSYARLDLSTGRERVKSFFAFEVMPEGEKEIDSETRIGWSAPRHPMQAIDDTEFDLATIREARGTTGACAWLRDVNPHVARSIRARQQRWSREWSGADGPGGEDIEAAQMLAKYRLNERAYPPSSLEEFARCPYRFFLKAIQRLRPVEEQEEPQRVDPRIRGEIYHSVQSKLPPSPGTLDEALADLDRVLEADAAKYADDHSPASPGVWRAAIESLRADLRGWIYFRWNYEKDWKILAAEHKFEETLASGWKLKGVIDALEEHSAGTVRVTDYKTGRAPRDPLRYTAGGESLQPVLYALAAEAMGHNVTEARLAYATLRSNYRLDAVQLDSRARMQAETVLRTIDNWIDKGFLPAAPRIDGCKRCEYVPVCGPYEELRVKQKSQPELRDLVRIREMP